MNSMDEDFINSSADVHFDSANIASLGDRPLVSPPPSTESERVVHTTFSGGIVDIAMIGPPGPSMFLSDNADEDAEVSRENLDASSFGRSVIDDVDAMSVSPMDTDEWESDDEDVHKAF